MEEAPAGALVTRSGKVIQECSEFEQREFKTPAAGVGYWRKDQSKFNYKKERHKIQQTYVSTAKLAVFNEKMRKKGFLRPASFENIAIMS